MLILSKPIQDYLIRTEKELLWSKQLKTTSFKRNYCDTCGYSNSYCSCKTDTTNYLIDSLGKDLSGIVLSYLVFKTKPDTYYNASRNVLDYYLYDTSRNVIDDGSGSVCITRTGYILQDGYGTHTYVYRLINL